MTRGDEHSPCYLTSPRRMIGRDYMSIFLKVTSLRTVRFVFQICPSSTPSCIHFVADHKFKIRLVPSILLIHSLRRMLPNYSWDSTVLFSIHRNLCPSKRSEPNSFTTFYNVTERTYIQTPQYAVFGTFQALEQIPHSIYKCVAACFGNRNHSFWLLCYWVVLRS